MMMQKDKELLLQDLCARLPYGVKVTTTNPAVELGVISGISIKSKISVSTKDADIVFECTEVKPYLRPMSSMTEEEVEEFDDLMYSVEERCINAYGKGGYTLAFVKINDWLNAHHFDYRGLIDKGLALKAPEGMYE